MKKSLTFRIIFLAATFCMLLTVIGCSGSGAQIAAQGTVDNVRWALDDDGCLSFTGTGAIPGVEYTLSMETGLSQTVYPEWYDYREQVTKVIIGTGIDSISMNAFLYFTSLEEMDISTSVTRIDGYAISGCTALERVIIRCPSVDMERYCIGYTGGIADSNLSGVTFVGAAGSQVEDYADACGARFSKL